MTNPPSDQKLNRFPQTLFYFANCKREIQTYNKQEVIFHELIEFIKLMPQSSQANGNQDQINEFLKFIEEEKNTYFTQSEKIRILNFIKNHLLKNDENEIRKFENHLKRNTKNRIPFFLNDRQSSVSKQEIINKNESNETSLWGNSSNYIYQIPSTVMNASSHIIEQTANAINTTGALFFSSEPEIHDDISMTL